MTDGEEYDNKRIERNRERPIDTKKQNIQYSQVKSRRDGDEVRDLFISGSHWELLFCC